MKCVVVLFALCLAATSAQNLIKLKTEGLPQEYYIIPGVFVPRNIARARCQAQGDRVAILTDDATKDKISQALLSALKENGIAKGLNHYWVSGSTTTIPAHKVVTVDQISYDWDPSARCLSYSDYRQKLKDMRLFAKSCSLPRGIICQKPAPIIDPTEPPAPIVDSTEPPAPIVDPTEPPAPIVHPTEPPAPIVDPTEPPAPIVDPTEKPTIPPGVETTKAEGPTTLPADPTCTKQKKKFAAQNLPIDEPKLDFLCRFNPKQCSDDRCWCVNARSGKVKGDGFSFPKSESYHCIGRIRNCVRAYIAAIEQNPRPGYVPSCDKAGYYAKEQCDTDKKECWCAKSRGGEIKKSRVPGDSVTCA